MLDSPIIRPPSGSHHATRRRDPDRRVAAPDRSRRGLHLTALSGFAVAQPLLGLLGRHPPFFLAHDAGPLDLVALTVVLCLLVPALLWAVERILGLVSTRLERASHTAFIILLAGAVWLQLLRKVDRGPGALGLLLALALGAATSELYARSSTFRSYLSLLSPSPLVFAGAFLFASPVSRLVLPARDLPRVEIEVDAEIPVVMVVFDELSLPALLDPSLRIDADRFPNFAALARRCHWFRNATTTAELTSVAVPAILTGRRLGEGPGGAELATVEKHPRNLFTFLAPSYKLTVFEPMTELCPRQLCGAPEAAFARFASLLADLAVVYPHTVLPAGLTRDLPGVTYGWRAFGGQASRAAREDGHRPQRIFDDFLAALRSGERRALYFLHFPLPHRPWRFLPSGQSYGTPGTRLLINHGLSHGRWGRDELAALQGFQRYLLQLQWTDRLLGRLLDTLEETGLYDPALLVVTADHGVSFRAGLPYRRLAPGNVQDVLSVPLFVKLPGQRAGSVSDRNAEIVDVLPTIAAVLGAGEAPWPSLDGASLLDSAAPERPLKVVAATPYDAGGVQTFDRSLLGPMSEAASRVAELFGRGGDPLDLYRFGPHAELVGSELAELAVAAAGDVELRLRHPWIYDDVDPGSEFLPARVVGEIRSPRLERGSLHLAVAIGGKVRAVTRTFGAGGDRASFAAMVPESSLSPGRNRPRIFVVDVTATGPRLIPTRLVERF